jgi:hypothetical protein
MTIEKAGVIAPFRTLCLAAALPAALAGVTVVSVSPAFAEEPTILLAQSQGQDQDGNRDQTGDQDRDRDWSDADRDQLRDGSCEQVAVATHEVLGAIRPCLDGGRMREPTVPVASSSGSRRLSARASGAEASDGRRCLRSVVGWNERGFCELRDGVRFESDRKRTSALPAAKVRVSPIATNAAPETKVRIGLEPGFTQRPLPIAEGPQSRPAA